MKAPRERDVRKWEDGILPEIGRLERSKARRLERRKMEARVMNGESI